MSGTQQAIEQFAEQVQLAVARGEIDVETGRQQIAEFASEAMRTASPPSPAAKQEEVDPLTARANEIRAKQAALKQKADSIRLVMSEDGFPPDVSLDDAAVVELYDRHMAEHAMRAEAQDLSANLRAAGFEGGTVKEFEKYVSVEEANVDG